MTDETNHPRPGGSPPDDAILSALLHDVDRSTAQLGRAQLWTLVDTDRPLHRLLDDPREIKGKLRRRDSEGNLVAHDFAMRCETKADVPALRLLVEGLAQYEFLGLVLGQYQFWNFEPLRYTEPVVGLPRKDRAANTESAVAMAAATEGREDGAEAIELDNDGPLSATYDPDEAELEVLASVPEDRDAEFAVAELTCTDAEGHEDRQLRGICLKQEPVGRSHDVVRFFKPQPAPGTGVAITVRPFTSDDLPLLKPASVHKLLAGNRFVSLPATKADDGIDFRVRWDDQREMLVEAKTSWSLQVAPRIEEG